MHTHRYIHTCICILLCAPFLTPGDTDRIEWTRRPLNGGMCKTFLTHTSANTAAAPTPRRNFLLQVGVFAAVVGKNSKVSALSPDEMSEKVKGTEDDPYCPLSIDKQVFSYLFLCHTLSGICMYGQSRP